MIECDSYSWVGSAMEVYVEEAVTEEEALRKIYKKYGTSVNIIRKHVKLVPYFFGLREREICEVSFSIDDQKKVKIVSSLQENKSYEKNVAFIDAHAKRIQMESSAKDLIEIDEEEQATEKVPAVDSYEKLEHIVQTLADKIEGSKKAEHEHIEKIKSILTDGDFSIDYVNSLIEKIKGELTLVELEDFSYLSRRTLDYIASSIETKPFTPISEKKIIAFVGPTGVGKTTSLVKLAALHFVHIQKTKRAKPAVHVITTDGYKIGGVDHIKRYCNCMGLSFSVADSIQSLRAIVDLNKERMDLLLMDSSGRNPNDKEQVAEVEKFINSIDKSIMEVHLVVNAGTKMKDIALIMEKYKGCRYDYVIVSKLDETSDVGNVISVLSQRGVPLSYVTVGQTVPTDITFAGKKVLLEKIKGFEEEREYIEENYKYEDEIFGDNIWLTKQKL